MLRALLFFLIGVLFVLGVWTGYAVGVVRGAAVVLRNEDPNGYLLTALPAAYVDTSTYKFVKEESHRSKSDIEKLLQEVRMVQERHFVEVRSTTTSTLSKVDSALQRIENVDSRLGPVREMATKGNPWKVSEVEEALVILRKLKEQAPQRSLP